MNGRAPGVYIEPADPALRPIALARSDVAAFVGIAERGPLDAPVRVTSFREFVRIFGSFVAPGFLAYAVEAFFENGGVVAWIVRTAAPAAGTSATPSSATRLTLAPALVLRPGTVVALQQARPGHLTATVMRQVTGADPAGAWADINAPVADVDAREVPAIDPTLPMLLACGAGNAQAVLLARDGSAAARFTTSTPGSWGNRIALRVQRQSTAQTYALATPTDGFARIPVASIAGFVRGTFVRVRCGSLTPVYRVVCDVDAATRSLSVASNDPGRALAPALNLPLPATFTVTPGSPPLAIDALVLHLIVLENNAVVEDYPQCSPLFPDVWNARLRAANSRITLDVASVAVATLDPQTWPADVAAHVLAGATDGVRMLQPGDVLGALATLTPLREPTLIAIPDACAGGDVAVAPPFAVTGQLCTDPLWLAAPFAPLPAVSIAALPFVPAEPGPAFDVDASARIAQGLVEFCETGLGPDSDLPPHPSFRFALVDVPAASNPIDFRRRFDASRAALHWPWAGVHDPLGQPGAVRYVPPSGHVAGTFAAMDIALGPHHSAANIELRWIVTLGQTIGAHEQGAYNDEQVNVIRALPNRGIRIYGARTLSSDALWLYVPVRRLMSSIEASILAAIQWAVFEPNNATLRQLVRRSCLTLLDALWQRGAFAGASADQAFYVRCDETNNPAGTQAQGQLRVDIGIAPVRPAEFIVFRIGHQFETLEVFEGVAA